MTPVPIATQPPTTAMTRDVDETAPLSSQLVLQRNGSLAFNGIAWRVEAWSGVGRGEVVQAMESEGVRGGRIGPS